MGRLSDVREGRLHEQIVGPMISLRWWCSNLVCVTAECGWMDGWTDNFTPTKEFS